MSSEPNPPSAVQPPVPPAITPTMIESLRQTKPWVRFLSVLGFIFTALMVVAGVFLALGAALLPSTMANSPLTGAPLVLIGLLYIGLGTLYVVPCVFLFRYADGIRKALNTDLVGGVEHALKYQKSFWKFVGILMLIMLVIQVAVLLLLIVVGIAGLSGLRSLQG